MHCDKIYPDKLDNVLFKSLLLLQYHAYSRIGELCCLELEEPFCFWKVLVYRDMKSIVNLLTCKLKWLMIIYVKSRAIKASGNNFSRSEMDQRLQYMIIARCSDCYHLV